MLYLWHTCSLKWKDFVQVNSVLDSCMAYALQVDQLRSFAVIPRLSLTEQRWEVERGGVGRRWREVRYGRRWRGDV